MRSNYKQLGEYIRYVDGRNRKLQVSNLIGLSIQKKFIPSISNTIGTDMTTYRIINKNQLAYCPVTSRNGEKITIALYQQEEPAIISQAYDIFEIIDTSQLLPEYLMIWFSRPEFDRYARFMSHGSVREMFSWEDLCNIILPIPHPDKQKEIVKEYNIIVDRINLNNQLIQKLEETAQAIYKQWYVDFEFPDVNGNPYKSAGGEMEKSEYGDIPKGWEIVELISISEMKYGKMLNEEKYTEKGYPVFSGYGIRGYNKEFMYEESQIVVLARGVSGTGEVRMSPQRSYITNLSIIVEVDKLKANKNYLYLFLGNHNLRSLDSGSAQSQITINDLRNVKILNPQINLQNEFGKLIDKININLKNLSDDVKLLQNIKDIILSKIATIEN